MPLVEAGVPGRSRDQTRGSARGRSLTTPGLGRNTLSPRHPLRGLTLQQANDPQRRGFLQRVAEAHGSASAKKAKSVLHGVIGYAVDNGVLFSDATRQVRTVTSTAAKSMVRDHTSGHDAQRTRPHHPGNTSLRLASQS